MMLHLLTLFCCLLALATLAVTVSAYRRQFTNLGWLFCLLSAALTYAALRSLGAPPEWAGVGVLCAGGFVYTVGVVAGWWPNPKAGK